MKKVTVTLLVAFVLFSLCTFSVLAVTPTNHTKAQLVGDINASSAKEHQKAEARKVVERMTDAQAMLVDVASMRQIGRDLRAKMKNGTLTAADVVGTQDAVNAALNGAAKVLSITNVSIDLLTGKVAADVEVEVNGETLTVFPYGHMTIFATSAGSGAVIKPTGPAVWNALQLVCLFAASVFGFVFFRLRRAATMRVQ